jgi:hypothetical protein
MFGPANRATSEVKPGALSGAILVARFTLLLFLRIFALRFQVQWWIEFVPIAHYRTTCSYGGFPLGFQPT